jgi:GTP cyclohydrolase I
MKGLNLDSDAEGLRDTSRRVADFYEEFFTGLHRDPAKN